MVCQAPGWSQQQDKCRESYILPGFLTSISHGSSPPFSTHLGTHLKLFLMARKLFPAFPGSPVVTVFSVCIKTHAYAHGCIKAECWIEVFITNVCMCTHTHMYAGCVALSCLLCYTFLWESSLQLGLHPFSSTTCHIHSQNWSALKTTSLTFLNLLAKNLLFSWH